MMGQAAQSRLTFTAQTANYLGNGNVRTDYPDGGWSWNVIDLKLGRYKARLTQQREVIANKIKPVDLIYTTDLEISGIKKYVEGETATNDLCHLLALASFSQVVPLKYRYEGSIVEGPQERYRLDWPSKREALPSMQNCGARNNN